MDALIAAIKAKRDLANLDDTFVREKVEKFLSGDARIARKLGESRDFAQFARSKEYERVLKHVRKELRTIYGVFQIGARGAVTEETLRDVLATHISTRERLPYYDALYAELARRIPAPAVVLDLGCGLNPLTQPWMRSHAWNPRMICVDVSSADMSFLAGAMKSLKIPGETIVADLANEKGMRSLDAINADVTLVLKLLDTLETAQRHVSYKLFEHITSHWIVVSFATKALGGTRNIAVESRSWFERLLERKNLKFETFSLPNELVYVCQRSKMPMMRG